MGALLPIADFDVRYATVLSLHSFGRPCGSHRQAKAYRTSGNVSGGEGGIRTHGTVSRSQHFQCCQFNHSCTSPRTLKLLAERVGFEPTVGVNPLRFSRPVH